MSNMDDMWLKTISNLPRRSVPVILTKASITERVVLPSTRWWRGAARLLGTTPFMGVKGDTGCLVAERACGRCEGTFASH